MSLLSKKRKPEVFGDVRPGDVMCWRSFQFPEKFAEVHMVISVIVEFEFPIRTNIDTLRATPQHLARARPLGRLFTTLKMAGYVGAPVGTIGQQWWPTFQNLPFRGNFVLISGSDAAK